MAKIGKSSPGRGFKPSPTQNFLTFGYNLVLNVDIASNLVLNVKTCYHMSATVQGHLAHKKPPFFQGGSAAGYIYVYLYRYMYMYVYLYRYI